MRLQASGFLLILASIGISSPANAGTVSPHDLLTIQQCVRHELDSDAPYDHSLTPERLRPTPLTKNSIILDSNMITSLRAKAERINAKTEYQAYRRVIGYFYKYYKLTDFRIPDTVAVEIRQQPDQAEIEVKRFSMDPRVTSEQRQNILQRLRQLNVGGGKGVEDRDLLTQIFCADSPTGTPVFITSDKGIYNGMARAAGIDPNTTRVYEKYYPNGFDVLIEGRKIHIIPVPAPQKASIPGINLTHSPGR